MQDYHSPVMLAEVLSLFGSLIGEDRIVIDCTFGRGGHTLGLLKNGYKVIAIDRDEESIDFGMKQFASYIQENKLYLAHSKFSSLPDILHSLGIDKIYGLILDLGLSSPQIDCSNRGFSYIRDGPLSMCMGLNTISAQDLVNKFSQDDIANIIYHYGEERCSRKIAKMIVLARKIAPIVSTFQLRDIIKTVVGERFWIKTCARVFQAIRIYVNDELNELNVFLEKSSSILQSEGILCVISFHSLEDRIIKRFFQHGFLDTMPNNRENKFDINFNKHHRVFPSASEISTNSRARSAILRWAVHV
ncbi:16S rRNA (cytosine(1402)-N(4))-methyltransferase RsmH [Candidatus Gromoviella agglomerans]|uniref:16S rRNA (cytosine(1402)-N(4))-methyltransferase RsmH n=1 Tax=Candidatus Gromoviella agglomerans TaxID=2806609 RepID=UPI001E4653BB|nr:16S rRNA (cytosine(1402)-N(4))-methyltransferase RsmH [Candidatus Gromoviella agglomerans]UFX98211.1 Ribosomal RNA small subunit methyltransferase H [Candidatus Gromoviella agglomerans]